MKGRIRITKQRAKHSKRARQHLKAVKNPKRAHPIEDAINKLVHSVLDIRECESAYLAAAKAKRRDDLTKYANELKSLANNLEASKEERPTAKTRADLLSTIRRLKRTALSKPDNVIQQSLYNYLFSSFDFFIGDLVSALFESKSDLFHSLDRDVKFKDVLTSDHFSQVAKRVLDKEIDSLRRESYTDQFKWLEGFFGIELRKWNEWPRFIEASQRRNLYVHCNGVVSEQYLAVCKAAGCKFQPEPKVGEKLSMKQSYFQASASLVMDAGVFLAHSLWRKVIPDEINVADDSLNELIYERLLAEDWSDAERFGRFRIDQKKNSTDLSNKMATINLAIALKFKGDASHVRLIDGIDWSSALPEFKLARAVLKDDFGAAAKVMASIGIEGEFVNELAYHTWPLFREFRKSDEFSDQYLKVYGRPFASVAQGLVEGEAKSLSVEVESISEQ